MDIDEGLAQRVREALLELAEFADISERKMFGALITLVNGHMTCGISAARAGKKIRPRRITKNHDTTDQSNHAPTDRSGIMLRVGARNYEQALKDPHCRVMNLANKTMTGFVFVDSPGLEEDEDLRRWLELSLSFVLAMPPK